MLADENSCRLGEVSWTQHCSALLRADALVKLPAGFPVLHNYAVAFSHSIALCEYYVFDIS